MLFVASLVFSASSTTHTVREGVSRPVLMDRWILHPAKILNRRAPQLHSTFFSERSGRDDACTQPLAGAGAVSSASHVKSIIMRYGMRTAYACYIEFVVLTESEIPRNYGFYLQTRMHYMGYLL